MSTIVMATKTDFVVACGSAVARSSRMMMYCWVELECIRHGHHGNNFRCAAGRCRQQTRHGQNDRPWVSTMPSTCHVISCGFADIILTTKSVSLSLSPDRMDADGDGDGSW